MGAQFAALDDVRTRRVARHEDVRLQAGPSSIRSERATGIASAGNREFCRAEIFCHRNGHAHPARLETLRRVE